MNDEQRKLAHEALDEALKGAEGYGVWEAEYTVAWEPITARQAAYEATRGTPIRRKPKAYTVTVELTEEELKYARSAKRLAVSDSAGIRICAKLVEAAEHE